MRKRYLIQLKNELFMQGFVFSEIHDILVDTAMYFDDSQTEEDVQKSILKNLGTPKEFARSIKQSDTSQPAGKMRVFRIILAFIAPLAFIIGMFLLAAKKQQDIHRQIVVSVLVFSSMGLLWFISGNACLFGILSFTKKQVKKRIWFQGFLVLLIFLLLYGMYIGVPAYIDVARAQNTLNTVGGTVHAVMVFCVALNGIIAVYCLVAFWKAEWLMFGILVQSVALICCAVFYEQYLGNLTVFGKINYFPLPLLLSV